MPEQMTTAGFQEAIRAGRFLPGDAVLYSYGRPSLLARAIRRVQRRALADLLAGSDDPEALAELEGAIVEASQYTHAGMVEDRLGSTEMTSPRARRIAWTDRLQPGCRILVVRPRLPELAAPQFAPDGMADVIRRKCLRHAARLMALQIGTPYPWRELLTYWFSSLPGAISAPHFVDHFRSHSRDVCSGAVWTAWRAAGAVSARTEGDSMPEAWYPGRMAWDACAENRYMACVGQVEVMADDPAAAGNNSTEKGGEAMRATGTRYGLESLATAALVCAAVAGMALLSGCRGMGRNPDEAGIGRSIKVYEINVAPDARSQVFIGTVATQTPMYQETENAAEQPANGTAYVTSPTQPVTAGTNGGTASGKYVLQVINDGAKRTAETDLATAATLASGLQQSQVGQTAPQTLREGTSTGTQTQTSSPQQNDSTQVNPNTPVATGGGTAQVTSPVSTQAGSGSTPGAVTGGSGAGTQTAGKTCAKCGQAVTADADGDGTCDGCEEPAASTTTK